MMSQPREFNIGFLDELSQTCLQHAIDGVNKAAFKYPDAWEHVASGKLREAEKRMGGVPTDPISAIIFGEMEQDGHSGFTGSWTIAALTQVAQDFPGWRTIYCEHQLKEMRIRLEDYIEETYLKRYAQSNPMEHWVDKRHLVMSNLGHALLARTVLTDEDRTFLGHLLKMESVSHLGNEVLFDMIEEQFQLA